VLVTSTCKKKTELEDLKLRAELKEKTVSELLREKVFEILQSPLFFLIQPEFFQV